MWDVFLICWGDNIRSRNIFEEKHLVIKRDSWRKGVRLIPSSPPYPRFTLFSCICSYDRGSANLIPISNKNSTIHSTKPTKFFHSQSNIKCREQPHNYQKGFTRAHLNSKENVLLFFYQSVSLPLVAFPKQFHLKYSLKGMETWTTWTRHKSIRLSYHTKCYKRRFACLLKTNHFVSFAIIGNISQILDQFVPLIKLIMIWAMNY